MESKSKAPATPAAKATAAPKHQVGDVVRLKSGGPLMTISSLGRSSDTTTAFCAWFSDDGQAWSHSFPLDCLKI